VSTGGAKWRRRRQVEKEPSQSMQGGA
jgi:hypothetical protein